MVLKKPYAFLIKYFRLIHLVITVLFGIVALQNRDIYKFLKNVIENSANRYNADMYIKYGVFVVIFLALILCFLVQWLLKYKDKPRRLYKFTIAIYVVIAVFLVALFSYMSTFSNVLMEQKTIRLYRDILTIALLFQYYTVFAMLIRGLGFDLKKFDFNRDLHELNLSEADSEEVEVNAKIDTTNALRMARKGRREFGYFYQEFKGYIITILVIVFGILGYKAYKYINFKYKIYGENEYFGNRYYLSIKNSYHASIKDTEYIIVNFNIYKSGVKEQFNVGDLVFVDGNKEYSADKNICHKFKSLGNCYKKQYITDKEGEYILVYEVGKLSNKTPYVVYTDYYGTKYKVRLTLKEY